MICRAFFRSLCSMIISPAEMAQPFGSGKIEGGRTGGNLCIVGEAYFYGQRRICWESYNTVIQNALKNVWFSFIWISISYQPKSCGSLLISLRIALSSTSSTAGFGTYFLGLLGAALSINSGNNKNFC